jgi:hypothetical protein
MVSGVSKRLILLPSFSADLDIFEVPSKRDMMRAPVYVCVCVFVWVSERMGVGAIIKERQRGTCFRVCVCVCVYALIYIHTFLDNHRLRVAKDTSELALLAKLVVETPCNVTGELEVLPLVFSNGDEVGLVEEDVLFLVGCVCGCVRRRRRAQRGGDMDGNERAEDTHTHALIHTHTHTHAPPPLARGSQKAPPPHSPPA